jgi:hypothetical protein
MFPGLQVERSLVTRLGARTCDPRSSADISRRRKVRRESRLSSGSWSAAQMAISVAISVARPAASGRSFGAVIDLVFGSAVVEADEVLVIKAAVVLISPRQQRHSAAVIGELLDCRGIAAFRWRSVRHRKCYNGAEQDPRECQGFRCSPFPALWAVRTIARPVRVALLRRPGPAS